MHKLAESLAEKPQPILCSHIGTDSITQKTTGYRQGEGPQVKLVTFEAIVGMTTAESPLEIVTEEIIDTSSGARTSTPKYLHLVIGSHKLIISNVGGYHYDSGEERWLNQPEVYRQDHKALAILGMTGAGRPNFTTLHTDFGKTRLVGINHYEIYVGNEQVSLGLHDLQEKYSQQPHDEATLDKIISSAKGLDSAIE